ncbi:MAG: heavy metal translocating P-type ATPase metal-binding domain-containing protein [Cyclobacteriaceae bacterium]
MIAEVPVEVEKRTTCYHCGDPCQSDLIKFDDKAFCCHGCKTVFQILDENDLCNYYDLEESPGISLKSKDFGDKFSYLENEQIQDQLLEFKSGKHHKAILSIPSIHCSSCIWLLENLAKIRDGINSSRVNFPRKELDIIFNPETLSLRQIVELLSTLGYEPQINLTSGEGNKKSKFDSIIVKLGVAGFCFGNIMLLSFPEYFGIKSATDAAFIQLFNWLNVILVIPIVFYSGLDYITSAFRSIRQTYLNIDVPITLGVFALFIQSIFEIVSNTGAGYLDSLAGLIFFLLIGKWFQSKTYENLAFDRDYKSYFPLGIMKVVNDRRVPVPIQEVKKGDVLLIRNKELIPADCKLLSDSANIDYSFVTGESEPEQKTKGETLYAGGKQIGESIEVLVNEEVSQSKLVKLWNQDAFQTEDSSSFQFVDTVARYFTPAILLIALASASYWYVADTTLAIKVFSSVLIVACPCALALASPFTYGSVLRVLGGFKLYLKNAQVVEKIFSLDHIVFDKTGTLTDKNGDGVRFMGQLTNREKALVRSCVSHSTHPLSLKIFNHLSTHNSEWDVHKFKEIEGRGIETTINGTELKIGSAEFLNLDIADTKEIGTPVFVQIDKELKGHYLLSQQQRPGLVIVLNDLAQKFGLSLLSGDNDKSIEEWKSLFPVSSELRFKQSPEDKLNYVQSLQENGRHVMMIGDGLNDAGALKQSDVGFAVAEDISTFTPSSDGILEGGQFTQLPQLLNFITKSKWVLIAAFAISFLYNMVGLGLAVSGNLQPVYAAILMPLSSITIVGFTTISVNLLKAFIKT